MHPADSWLDRTPWDRCITYHGVPPVGTNYNNTYHIVQTPDVVAIHVENIHDVRIIPIGDRPHLDDAIRQWNGDSRGHWEGNTRALFTPVELPEELAGQELSADELLARAEAAGEWKGSESSNGVGAYGFHWFDWHFDDRQDIGQPALVVDPATGRIPARTASASESIAMSAAEQFDSADRMDADDRCISRGQNGMWPTHVNNGKLILQTPGYVVIHSEMIHNVRIIPIDTPHAHEKIRLWNGDPRGRWEGNTLVVESTNFRAVPHIRGTSPSNPSCQSEAQHTTERFTLVGPDVLQTRSPRPGPSPSRSTVRATTFSSSSPVTRGTTRCQAR